MTTTAHPPPSGEPMAEERPRGATAEQLRRRCDLDEIPVASTAELDGNGGVFGQPRAFEALDVATGIPADGYNVFATGPAGTGKRTMIAAWLHERAAHSETPPDLVHLYNFAEPLRPHSVPLPTGSARALARDVERLVDDARRHLAQALQSESYRARHRQIHEEFDQRRAAILEVLESRARAAGVAIQLTPAGAITAPIAAGRALKPNEIAGMPDDARADYEAAVAELKDPVETAFRSMLGLDRELRERHAALRHEVASFALGHLVEEVQHRWAHTPRVVAWLDAVREDAIENLDLFRQGSDDEEESPAAAIPMLAALTGGGFLARYAVNVLVSNEPGTGAPVVVASDPSFFDIFGRVEYETTFGAVTTDHRHLRAGLVHRASGGFLVLQADELLTKPMIWPRLKDVLRTGRLKIENPATQYMLFPGVTLDPEPVEIRLTVVLVGTTELYSVLHAIDDDVARLFKLRADFDDEMPRDPEGVGAYAGMLGRLVHDRGLLDLDRGAIAAIVEHGGRLAGHRDRLSTEVRELSDIVTEAAHLAASEQAPQVGAGHVAAALRARRRRSDLIEQKLLDETLEGTVEIEVSGRVPGQVNGLAVAMLADHVFGHPVRITATVAPGEGEVVDIDREARLSGPVHAKGVLILSGYLAGHYFLDRPMTLRASIVFEQSYGPVEGDSASTAELLALLSALAGLGADQGIAVTGAVDQQGAVHAVGGINEKIEGFFALCEARGLTGDQGVIVPEANLPHLMLDERVVDAVAQGRFHVWPIRTVDEALTLVTGAESADARVRERLLELSHAAQAARSPVSRNGGPRRGRAGARTGRARS